MNIKTPYLVFLGDAKDYKQAKVAHGVVEWRPELCIGQMALDGCEVDLGLKSIGIDQAVELGAKTFLIGISPYTTTLPENYVATIKEAMNAGMDIASPLHDPLSEELEDAANVCGVRIFNFRHRTDVYPKGNGQKRKGNRLLTVGTDCACGKKFTSLAITKALQAKNVPTTFRATGQTGFLISQSGINNDTIPADFLSGAAEWLTPDNDANHWDIVEGQGALSHPSFGAGALSLIYGTQPDIVVMCTEPGRPTQRGVSMAPMGIVQEVEQILLMGKRTNPNIKCGVYSLFTRDADVEDIEVTVTVILNYDPDAIIFDPNVIIRGGKDKSPLMKSLEDFDRLVGLLTGAGSNDCAQT